MSRKNYWPLPDVTGKFEPELTRPIDNLSTPSLGVVPTVRLNAFLAIVVAPSHLGVQSRPPLSPHSSSGCHTCRCRGCSVTMPPQGKDAKNKASSAAQAASKSGGKGGKKKVRPLSRSGVEEEVGLPLVSVSPWVCRGTC